MREGNPYIPTKASLVDHAPEIITGDILPVYTPLQVRLASFVGGPFASVWTLYKNFKQLRDARRMRLTLVIGVIFIIALLIVLPFLPEHSSNLFIPLLYSISAGGIASAKQISKQQMINSTLYKPHSGRNVFCVIVVSLTYFCLTAIPLYFLLDHFGVINLG